MSLVRFSPLGLLAASAFGWGDSGVVSVVATLVLFALLATMVLIRRVWLVRHGTAEQKPQRQAPS